MDDYRSSATMSSVKGSVVPGSTRINRLRGLIATLLLTSLALTSIYAAISLYVANQLVYMPPTPLYSNPGALGLEYKNVSFLSREDHIQLSGWLIPGILPNGHLTTQRTIIFVHGIYTNRADKNAGLLLLSAALARHGFAVLSFDMRGMGESAPAPVSLGYFEQRDVLGALDFLRDGLLPYPELGRPRVIGGWGVSMGGAALLLAAAHEQNIQAIVTDSVFADLVPILEREVPKRSHLPAMFTPGTLQMARILYGMDLYDVRPIDALAQIAPRPILFIHGAIDHFIPPSNMYALATAARSVSNAHVQTWLVPGAGHAQSFNVMGQIYVARIVAFYNSALGADTGADQVIRKKQI